MIKIYSREFGIEQLKTVISQCNSISECIHKLGFTYDNARLRNGLLEIINKIQIDIGHFDSLAWHKNQIKYPKIVKICPVCQKEFETQQGLPREKETCSRSCSNTYFSKMRHTKESNQKCSNSLILFYGKDPALKRIRKNRSTRINKNRSTRIIYIKMCKVCNKQFESFKREQRCCSNRCAVSLRNQDPLYKKKLSGAMQKRIANGTHKGWSSRTKLKPSYAEKYVIDLLNELNISYIRELKVGKWFIDFADIKKKLALEIDGKQHNLPERKLSDEQKDLYLVNDGWQVLRIKWKKITKEFRDELIFRIYNFLG